MPAVDSVAAEEWDYLEIDVLRPARSSRVCMTCQHFRYEVGRDCVTLLPCPIHQGLIPQGEYLAHRPPADAGVYKAVRTYPQAIAQKGPTGLKSIEFSHRLRCALASGSS